MRPVQDIIMDRRVRVIDSDFETGAAFRFRPERDSRWLNVIMSIGMGWDHVSVSTSGKTPSWREMEAVKSLCFEPHETAMQLHVPPSDHISIKHNCLHIWRPHSVDIPMPPAVMV
jgi:hypothetical protein